MKRDNYVPESLVEAVRYFTDPDNAHAFMAQLRWPTGVVCPHCAMLGNESKDVSFYANRRVWRCQTCKKQFSVKVGTIFEDSPLTLDKWLVGMWLIANAKNGISSHEIARALGITQKSAWFLDHRIRLAMKMGSIEKSKMQGTVEADETFIGGKASNMHKSKKAEKIQGRGSSGKEIVMGLLQRFEDETGLLKTGSSEVRVKHIPDTSGETLQGEVRANVEAGSEVFTDAAPAYRGLSPEYYHEFVDHAVSYAEGRVSTNGLENFWSLFDRCLMGTWTHVDPYHLFRYLDEQAFRFNARKLTDADRFLLVTGAVSGKRLTYKELIGKVNHEQETQE
ncbi:MAG: IS1595 family transposase [Abitibacteriaceae bacterium]|nr:IS1595 family transposase [Abditibacteriaceae bacterium]